MNKQAIINFAIEWGQALFSCFTKFSSFEGNAKRKEFWYFAAFALLVMGAARGVDIIIFDFHNRIIGPVMLTSFLFLLLPCSAVIVRRLHDRGKSGWWHLAFMLGSAAAFFFAIIFWSQQNIIPLVICITLWSIGTGWLFSQLVRE